MNRGLILFAVFGLACAGMRYDRGHRALAAADAPVRVVKQIAPSDLAWFEARRCRRAIP